MNLKKGILSAGFLMLLLSISFALYSFQQEDNTDQESIANVGPYMDHIDPALIAEIEAIEKVIDISEMNLVDATEAEANQPFRACLYTLTGVNRLIPPPFPVWLSNGGQLCFAPAAPGTLCPTPVPGQGPYRIVWNNMTVGSCVDFFASSSTNQACPNTAGRRVVLNN